MLRLRPVSRSHRAARTWTWAPPPLLAVEHRRPCVAVGFQPRPSRLLELVEHGFDLLVGGSVLRGPRDHAGGVLVLERPACRPRRPPCPGSRAAPRRPRAACRPRPAPRGGSRPPPRAEPVPRARNLTSIAVLDLSQRVSAASSRSMGMRWPITSTASMPPPCEYWPSERSG